jgi:hypothetical protein
MSDDIKKTDPPTPSMATEGKSPPAPSVAAPTGGQAMADKPVRIAEKGIVIRHDFAVTADKEKYPHAVGGHYRKAQVIPSPTEAERAFVALKWATDLKEVK